LIDESQKVAYRGCSKSPAKMTHRERSFDAQVFSMGRVIAVPGRASVGVATNAFRWVE